MVGQEQWFPNRGYRPKNAQSYKKNQKYSNSAGIGYFFWKRKNIIKWVIFITKQVCEPLVKRKKNLGVGSQMLMERTPL